MIHPPTPVLILPYSLIFETQALPPLSNLPINLIACAGTASSRMLLKFRMLLGNASCLAYDIGIFDDDDREPLADSARSPHHRYRKSRLLRLFYVYIHSFSARYGRGSALLPHHVTTNTEQWISNFPLFTGPTGTPEEDWRYLRAAVGLTKLMKTASEILFPDKRTTRELLRSGNYIPLLSQFEPLLKTWRDDFDRYTRKCDLAMNLMSSHVATFKADASGRMGICTTTH
jgi:hypothetical protein